MLVQELSKLDLLLANFVPINDQRSQLTLLKIMLRQTQQ